jgi:hypothetical protein
MIVFAWFVDEREISIAFNEIMVRLRPNYVWSYYWNFAGG